MPINSESYSVSGNPSFTLTYGLALLFLTASWAVASPNPDYGKIELLRDRWGVPHIYADTDEGAMYGLGYAQAEDRAFQMYLSLRLIQGRIAETIGVDESRNGWKEAVKRDRQMRLIGYYRHAQQLVKRLDDDTQSLLKAFSEGVNDYVQKNPDKLLHLFQKFDLKPEPWTAADCLASWWRVALLFSQSGLHDARPQECGSPNYRRSQCPDG